MILVEESLLPGGHGSVSPSKIQSNLKRASTNSRIRNICNAIREQVGDKSCPEHQEYASKLIVGVSKEDYFIIKEVDFCCEAFKSTIAFLVEA